ncbi:amidase domain-containing protein [Clostridium sp. SHJSY1]|uniref:amidase domain-containing protein n=1 Tax=Clostridium sp. SHJSY1 TaxID=2942483 RepID=UPI00287BA04E|nr:amidase domain-containing protein [Clostridium sp. SHJSY1]
MKILYMINKEEFPIEYNSLLQNHFNKEFNLNFIKHNLERQNYNKFIENIDTTYEEFNKITSSITRKDYNKPEYNLNKDKIIKYARKYALNYNKSYKNFDNTGGDCTNFVSQCLHEGGLPYSLNWKPYTTTWIRVNELYYYALKIGFNSTDFSAMNTSDIIQFHSIKKGFFSHSGIISEILPNNDCLYCCHSFDKLDYPLSEVYPLFYNKIRIINI